ncbi:MAG: hypothetical protein ACON49_07385 [Candidatus Puniceispirillaceae bacterium]
MAETRSAFPFHTNPNTYIGQQIAIVKLPAPAQFKTQKGLQIFGPNYLGLES